MILAKYSQLQTIIIRHWRWESRSYYSKYDGRILGTIRNKNYGIWSHRFKKLGWGTMRWEKERYSTNWNKV
jgi:hypothetical protein